MKQRNLIARMKAHAKRKGIKKSGINFQRNPEVLQELIADRITERGIDVFGLRAKPDKDLDSLIDGLFKSDDLPK